MPVVFRTKNIFAQLVNITFLKQETLISVYRESSYFYTGSIQIQVKRESLFKYSKVITLNNTSVLVCLGCYNKNILDGVVYKQHKFTFHNSVAWEAKVKASRYLVPGENPFPG